METIRKTTDLPIAVGFGIKDAETARLIGENADGVVVGSALVKLIAEFQDDRDTMMSKVSEFVQSLRHGLDQ